MTTSLPQRLRRLLRPLLVAASSALAVAVALTALGQAPTLTADSDVEVRLVEVEVRVVGRDGERVEGLAADDFVLRVDGEEVPIHHFAAGRFGGVPLPATRDDAHAQEGGGATDPDAGSVADARHLIVYLDQRFLDAAELASARTRLLQFLRSEVPAGTRVMLASADDGLRIVHSFTYEPALVADALQGLEIGPGGGVWRTQYDQAMQEVQRYHDMGGAASADVVSLSRGGSSDEVRAGEFPLEATNGDRLGGPTLSQDENKGRPELIETDPRHSLQMIESFGQALESDLQASAAHLARLVNAASGLPGETSVLYVGGTLPVNATKTLFELWQDTYGDLADGADWVGQKAREQGWQSGVADAALESGVRFSRAIERLGKVADVASASGITFHTLDVSVAARLGRIGGDGENYRSGAVLRGGGRSTDTQLAERSDSGALLLADRTGGLTAANRRFESFFDAVSGQLTGGYTLAFQLPDPAGEGGASSDGLHGVEIELRQPRRWGKPEVHHRRKVTVKSLEQEQIQHTVSALALQLDLGSDLDNPLGVEVAAGNAQVGDDGGLRVPVSVKVPMSKLALVPDRQAHAGRLSIYVAVGDLERGVGLEKAVVPVRIANRDLLTAFGRTVDYRLDIPAPTGARRLAVTVRDDYRPVRSTVTARIGSLDESETAQPAEGGL